MKKATKGKKTASTGKTAMKIGAGLAAAGAAAAAGYYFYGSTHAKKHRNIAAKWAADMKKEVVKEAKNLKNLSPEAFAAVVDRIAKTYQGARSIQAKDVRRAANELKANWDMIRRETKRTVRTSASRARKTIGKRAK